MPSRDALPLLWRDRVIGWGNDSVVEGSRRAEVGLVSGRAPGVRGFARALDAEQERLRLCLGAESGVQRRTVAPVMPGASTLPSPVK